MATIKFNDLKKSYEKVDVIHGIEGKINSGEFTVILGESGCGKSTLMRMIAGLESITSGDLLIGNKKVNDIPPKERGIAMVFQNYALYPHMTVSENIAYGMKLSKVAKDEIVRRTKEVADILSLEEYLDRKPHELSGGQRQRVAIGRAIVREPEILLFDEPLSNLDAKLRVTMRIELRKLHDRTGATSVFVTHDQVEAMTLADTIIIMNKGLIEQIGSPQEIYHQPATTFVASFIGSPPMNLLDKSFAKMEGKLEKYLNNKAGFLNAETIGIRPEDINVNDTEGLPCMVDLIEDLGANKLVYCKLNGFQVTCSVSCEVQIKVGDRKHLQIDFSKLNLFDAQGKRV